MIDNEDRWIFYDDEETEVMMTVGRTVMSVVVEEVVRDVKQLCERVI